MTAFVLALSVPARATELELSPGLNLQYDAVRADHDNDSAESANDVRRARLSLRGKVGQRVGFKLEYDVKPDAWTDAFLEWTGDRVTWRAGQQKTLFGLEQLNSDRDWMFMESSVTDVLTFGRRLGIAADVPLPAGRIQVMAFDKDLRGRNGGTGVVVRGVWNPIHQTDQIVHLAAAAAYQRSRTGRASLNPHAESVVLPLRPLAIGAINNIDASIRLGLEATWIRGAWTLQSEWLGLKLDRSIDDDVSAQGAYISVSRMLTGERRRYNGSTLSGPSPTSRYGALEVAARVAHLRIDEGAIDAGDRTLDTFTFGVNWYLAHDIRVMLDAGYSETGTGDDLHFVSTRLQIAF